MPASESANENVSDEISLEDLNSFSSLKANNKIVDGCSCQVCSGRFFLTEDVYVCQKCGSHYHGKCWQTKGGCIKPECKDTYKKCPKCGREIKKAALKCRHCGAILDKALRERDMPKIEPAEASDALKNAIFGIFCFGIILGPIAISKAIKALKQINDEPGTPGAGKAIAAIIIGVIDFLGWVVGIISRVQ